MKIIASLIILGLCANACFGAGVAPVASTQSFSSSALNSTATKVYSVSNSTDAANWNPGVVGTAPTQVAQGNVIWAPGAANTTSYVYGIVGGTNQITKIIRRSLNNTVVGWGNDTTMTSVIKTDDVITTTISATSNTFMSASAPGYLALLTTGTDGASTANNQIYVNILTGTTPTQTKITSTSDVVVVGTTSPAVGAACTTTTFGLGNIWYDIGAGAFFYTYYKKVVSTAVATTAGTCGAANAGTVYTIYLGGIYVNSTVYWTSPLSLTPNVAANMPSALMGGGDNWLNATNIYVVYKDNAMATPCATYWAKTTKATTTSAGGSFSALVTDVTGTASVIDKQFSPIGVWASNYTYGVGVANRTATAVGASPTTFTYTIGNYLNGTTTYTDSGISYSSATGQATGVWGWMLNTGYSLIGVSTTASNPAYTFGTFYGNGTVNTTASTLGTFAGSVGFYEDLNGTMWAGWQDVDSGNTGYTYAGYLAKFQGQLNVPSSGANALSTILAFVALFLASIFAF